MLSEEAEAEALCELCSSKLVLCSPLTRALQTCLLSLGRVLRARGQPIHLTPNARTPRTVPERTHNIAAAPHPAELDTTSAALTR